MNKTTYILVLHHKVKKFLNSHKELQERFYDKVGFLLKGESDKVDAIPLK
jgi:hypothetical protein